MKRTKKTFLMAAALMLAGSLVVCREERTPTLYGAMVEPYSPDSDITVGDTIKDETDDIKDETDDNKDETDDNKDEIDNSNKEDTRRKIN